MGSVTLQTETMQRSIYFLGFEVAPVIKQHCLARKLAGERIAGV
jgi:hypothetical protein